MLNEMIELFIGMFNYAITNVCGMSVSDFALYDYFVGIICVVVTVLMLAGAFSLLCVVVAGTFNLIWRTTK